MADSSPVIIPYKVINPMFTAIYDIITGSLSAYYSCARYSIGKTGVYGNKVCNYDNQSMKAIKWNLIISCINYDDWQYSQFYSLYIKISNCSSNKP